jgi:hypothetical protein
MPGPEDSRRHDRQPNERLYTLTRPIPSERRPLIDRARNSAFNLTEPMSTFLPPLLFSEEVPVDRLWRGNIPTQQAARKAYERQYRRRNLTEAGTTLRDAVAGRTVFDLGSGSPGRSLTPELLKLFGAKNYVGIEAHTLEKDIPPGTSRTEFRRMEILEFLSRLEIPDGAPHPVFFMSGLDPSLSGFVMDSAMDDAYTTACLEELQRVTKPGDPIIMFRTYGFDPTAYGFDLEYTSGSSILGEGAPDDLIIYRKASAE